MKAIIDADIFQWEFGSATDNEFKPLSWPLVQSRVQARIDGIMEATQADSYQLYLTSDDKSNYRYKIATIQPYKGHRTTEKPHWYTHIRNFLVDYRGAIEVFGQEADDALGIAQMQSLHVLEGGFEKIGQDRCKTVICSRDKDLLMIPGWHYIWGAGKQQEKKMWWQDEVKARQAFYKQLLTGDSVDNILGLYGVGKSSILLKHVDTLTTECDMFEMVLGEYVKRYGSYAEQFLIENARLLWIRRKEGEMWELPSSPS